MTYGEIEKVPLAALEAQSERTVRVAKYVSLGWAISVVMLTMALILSLTYSEEIVTESAETTAEVIQDASSNGSNYYAGGDLNGYANGQDDNNYDENDG